MTKADIIQQVKNLIAAPSCYAGLKEKAEAYLAVQNPETVEALVNELKADVQSIDEVLPFFVAQSPDSRLYSNTRVSSELYLYSFFHKFPNSFCVFSFSIFSI